VATFVDIRAILNGIIYVLSTKPPMARDAAARATSSTGAYDSTLVKIRHRFYRQRREQADREASAIAAVAHSQSVRNAEKGRRVSIPKAMTRQRSAATSGIEWGQHCRADNARSGRRAHRLSRRR
jgi:hypothetical protein